jgi:Ca2+/Na+ antiporter
VEVFIKQFEIPEEVAAVTLVAFGSAAPELFLNSVSAITHTSDLSLSAVLGSGMVAFGLIPSLCVLNGLRNEMKFHSFPILRECGFYLLGLFLFLLCIKDGKLGLTESICIVSVYLVYVTTVVIIYWKDLHLKKLASLSLKFYNMREKIDRNGGRITDEDIDEARDLPEDDETVSLIVHSPKSGSPIHLTTLDISSNSDVEQEDIEDATLPSVESGPIERVLDFANRCISTPIREILKNILPKLHPTHTNIQHHSHLSQLVPFWRAVFCFLSSILVISILASCIVAVSESMISALNLETATVGATLVAFGSEIPDTISSIALARGGYYDGALAGAIGSQVINISIGVGLPALFINLTNGLPLQVTRHEAQSLGFLATMLFLVICSYISLTIPVWKIIREKVLPEIITVTKSGATLQIILWTIMYILFLYINERD